MSPTKRKRLSYTAQHKLKVISYAEKTINRAAGKQFSVSEKLVRDWRKAKASLEKEPKERKARRGKLARYPDLEKKISDWCYDNDGNVTTSQIQKQALKCSDDTSFKASSGWVQSFMRRHGDSLHKKKKIAQKPLDDLEDEMIPFDKFSMNW